MKSWKMQEWRHIVDGPLKSQPREAAMPAQEDNLAHTKWECKYDGTASPDKRLIRECIRNQEVYVRVKTGK